MCHGEFCSNCLTKTTRQFDYVSTPFDPKGSFCPGCFRDVVTSFSLRYDAACRHRHAVRVFSANYKGKVTSDDRTERSIVSNWYRDKNECELDIRTQCAFLHLEIVQNVYFEKETGTEPSNNGKGTHYYTIWRSHGVGAKLMTR